MIYNSGRAKGFPAPDIGRKESNTADREVLYDPKQEVYQCTLCGSCYRDFADAQFCYRLCRIENRLSEEESNDEN